jgi:hypothetical protein
MRRCPQWVMVTVVHTRGRFMRKSEFSLYVDGYLRQSVHLKYPAVSEVCGTGVRGGVGR